MKPDMEKKIPAKSNTQDLCKQFGISQADQDYFEQIAKPLDRVIEELTFLNSKEPKYPTVTTPATIKNGFLKAIPEGQIEPLLLAFSKSSRDNRFVIPTAGAASRQFQLLRGLLNLPEFSQANTFDEFMSTATQITNNLIEPLSAEQKAIKKTAVEIQNELPRFWNQGILEKRYAFIEELADKMQKLGLDFESAQNSGDVRTICKYILSPDGLNYGFLPKVLMRLHAYPESDTSDAKRDCRLGLEEHIRTIAKLFSATKTTSVKIHFFLAEEHEQLFINALEELSNKPSLLSALREAGYEWKNLDITWDFQRRSTDSVSLDQVSMTIARDSDGHPTLRKAGHGTLLQNLSALGESGFWLQNVDNVLYDNPQIKPLIISFKQMMAAYGAQLESEAHILMRRLSAATASEIGNPEINQVAVAFIQEKLCTKLDLLDLKSRSELELSQMIFKLLDRPIVIAGYVPLEPGQAGGGPFVVKVQLGGIPALKVNTVEGSEFDGGQNNTVFKTGEFFNPVDLYVTRTRFDGSLYSFDNCIDPSRAFASSKTDQTGRPILAYERPGLWNGSLALAFQVSIALPSNVFAAIKTAAGAESFLSDLHQKYEGDSFKPLDFDRGVVTKESAAKIISNYR